MTIFGYNRDKKKMEICSCNYVYMYYLILEILFAAENYVSLPHQQISMAKFAQLENKSGPLHRT